MMVILNLTVKNWLVMLPLWVMLLTSGRGYDMAVISSSSIDLATDVGQVLLDNGHDVTVNKPLTYFVDDLNKWSLKKPVPSDDLFYGYSETITPDANNILNSDSDTYPWFVGKKDKDTVTFTTSSGTQLRVIVYYFFGLGIPTVDTTADVNGIKEIIDSFSSNGLNWEMVPPSELSIKRLGDFRGYSTTFVPPFQYHAGNTTTASTTVPISINGDFSTTDSQTQYINLKWLGSVIGDDWVIGALIVNSSGNYVTSATGSELGFASTGATLNSISYNNSCALSSMLSAGSYNAYFVLQNIYNSAQFIPLPSLDNYENPKSFTVTKYVDVYPSLKQDLTDLSLRSYFRYTRTSTVEALTSQYITVVNGGLCSYTKYCMDIFIDCRSVNVNTSTYTFHINDMTFSHSMTSLTPQNITAYYNGSEIEYIQVNKGDYKKITLVFEYIFSNSASASTITWTMAAQNTFTIKMPWAGLSTSDVDCPTLKTYVCITKNSASYALTNPGQIVDYNGNFIS